MSLRRRLTAGTLRWSLAACAGVGLSTVGPLSAQETRPAVRQRDRALVGDSLDRLRTMSVVTPARRTPVRDGQVRQVAAGAADCAPPEAATAVAAEGLEVERTAEPQRPRRLRAAERPLPAGVPTVVYRGPDVTVVAPRPLAEQWSTDRRRVVFAEAGGTGWCRSVLWHTVSGPDAGKILWHPVRDGHATFSDVPAGAVDVYYLGDAVPQGDHLATVAHQYVAGRGEPDRRVIVEQAGLPQVDAVSVMDLIGGDAVRAVALRTPTRSMAVSREGRGWSLLAKGSLFGARKAFLNDLRRCRLDKPDGDSVDVAAASETVLADLHAGRTSTAALAGRLANALPEGPAARDALYGLAKTYDAIDAERETILEGAHLAAEVAYRACLRLDPTCPECRSDLAVRLAASGRPAAALQLLGETGTLPGAEAGHNLAVLVERLLAPADAAEVWERVLADEPDSVAALRALTTTPLGQDGTALYGDQCRKLAERLERLLETTRPDGAVGQWAYQSRKRLQVVLAELALNRADPAAPAPAPALTLRPVVRPQSPQGEE